MENKVNERLKLLIKSSSKTQKKFCEIIDISEDTLKSTFKKKANPGTETLIKISEKFPQYSINWLLTGKGNKLEGSQEIEPLTESEFTAYLKSQIEDLKAENKRLTDQNGYFKGLLDANGISYKQTAT